ncbi:MAG: hypothetical protein Q7T61_15955 [Caulobacter sp.]|nr:hypothetical protein [Caulobacter sp.]
MKTHLLCAALALGLAATASAAAAQDSETITINSTVSKYCKSLGTPSPIALGELVDGVGFVVTSFAPGTNSSSVANYYCNAPATISLAATPLTQAAGSAILDPSSFTNRIDYLASLSWDNVSGSVNTLTGTPSSITSAEANTGNLTVTVTAPDTAGNKRPISGNYAGAVTVTVTLD